MKERQDEIEKEDASIEVFYGAAFLGVVTVIAFILLLFSICEICLE